MSARFEIVRTDAGWHARFRAANGRIVMAGEVLTRRSSAKKAVLSIAQGFALTPAYFTYRGDILHVYAAGVGVEVRDVDERGAR